MGPDKVRARRNRVFRWFGGTLPTLLILVGTPAEARAQLPAISSLSAGLLASHITLAEPHESGDSGYGSALRLGFPLIGPVSLESRFGRATVDHAKVAAEYDLWEAHLGARYTVGQGSDRLRPYVEALSSIRVGEIDRMGVTPAPDLTGLGAGLGVGANVRLIWDLWVALAAEGGLTWLQHGRVENGDWIRPGDDPGIRTRTTRFSAGVSWNP